VWIRYVGRACAIFLAASSMTIAGPSGGTIAGKVTYEGRPPKMKPIDMAKEPSCAKTYQTPPAAESVVTGAGNTLTDVLVYVSAGFPDESAPAAAVVFSQKGCRYVPHLLPFQVNQELQITNEDQAVHNIHTLPKLNREWNKSQMPGAPPITEKYDKAEFIPVKCNIHPWMRGTFAVLKNSHYAVSGEAGEFKLANLPPGKYTITAWQEIYGEQSQEVTIGGKETKTISFMFKVKPY
jgi:plastocyanin